MMLDIFAIVVFVGYCVLLGMYPIKTIVVSIRTAIAGAAIVWLAMQVFSHAPTAKNDFIEMLQ